MRHPFDRLLSAYRDKLEVYNKWYYSKYGKRMVGEWRAAGRVRAGDAFYSRDAGNGAPVRVAGRQGIGLLRTALSTLG